MSIKNADGQEYHPIDGYMFFKSSLEEREKGKKLYDEIINKVHGDGMHIRKVDELLSFVTSQVRSETEFFSQGD